ncbi:MAG TPA: ABC transporter substrate-binding protein [bacterium]|nr:ABC transporter substrate-binding protein [bacterium]
MTVLVAVTVGTLAAPPAAPAPSAQLWSAPEAQAAAPQFPAPGPRAAIVFGQPVAPPNVVHAPVELAKAFGFMDKFNVDLRTLDFDGSTRALTAAIAGGVNVGLIDCQVAAGNGVPIVAFYAPAPRTDFVLVARDTIKTLADLKGKKMGLSSPPGGIIDRFNRAILATAGLRADDVAMVPTTTAGRVPALVTGQSDTAIFHYEQASKVLRTQRGFHVLYDLYKALPDYEYNIYCGLRPWVEAHRDLIVNMTAATILAVRYAYAHRPETIKALTDITHEDAEDVAYAYGKIVTGCIWARNLGLDTRRLNWTTQWEHQAGNLRNPYDAAQILDMSIANEALAKAGGTVPVPEGCE